MTAFRRDAEKYPRDADAPHSEMRNGFAFVEKI